MLPLLPAPSWWSNYFSRQLTQRQNNDVMSHDSIYCLFAIGLCAAGIGSILGMTSGVFIVPVLTVFAHLDIHTAMGASLVSVIACSCGGAGPLLNAGLTNVRLAIALEMATTLGGACGVVLAGLLSSRSLFLVFAFVLLISAFHMFACPRPRHDESKGGRVRDDKLSVNYLDIGEHAEIAYRVEHLTLGLSLMYGAALLSSLVGIGSGVLKIPAMDASLRLPIKVSTATSSFMIGVTATAGAAVYFVRGNIQPMVVAPVALGSVLGTVLGVRGLLHMADYWLRLAFAGVLVILAVQVLLISLGVSAGVPL
jgi:uncharacterized membrane protein YfcA